MTMILPVSYFLRLSIISSYIERQLYLWRLLRLRMSIDYYSRAFLFLLGIIGMRVGVWSFYYLGDVGAYSRFVILLTAFIMSMVSLVLFSNLFISFLGWDVLGVSSFLLVVFFKNRKRLGSGLITALSNRIGDCFFFCLLAFSLGKDYYMGGALLILLRITKRAQFPFSAWLPAAIAAPTPVRALVHSSTLVTAGVYMLIRYGNCDLYQIMIIGSFTIVMAGFGACVENDLKKVVALRTLSQLGVMMVALGAQEKSYCFFHLMSHACFKALLFLCVGVCIHSLYGTQDFRSFNALSPSLFPCVFISVANFSLAGFIFTAGFHSKDGILEILMVKESSGFAVVFFLTGIFLTTCYTVKTQYMVIHKNSQTSTTTTSLGGFGWTIKTPFLLLGVCSVMFRSESLGLSIVRLNPMDKGTAFLLILTGLLFIGRSAIHNHPVGRRLLTLQPLSQKFAIQISVIGSSQKEVDKGWVEAWSLSISVLASSLTWHYNSIMGLGFCSFFLFVIFYVQHSQQGIDEMSGLGCSDIE